MPPQPRHGVFLSYARSDGEALASALRQRLEAEGIQLWRDREEMQGGRDWWLQIVAALDAVEYIVLIVTPAATQSPLVRKEWRHARQRGVCVYPLKGSPDLDINSLPRWMRSVHFYDPDLELPKLLNDLRTRCEGRRVPFMAEDLPVEFVRRPAEYSLLLSHVLDRAREEPIAITTALRAAGGYGKTVLARALCHDPDVQNAFDDGILWVTLGENPGDLIGRVEDLIYVLCGDRPGFSRIEAASARLVELLADRDILIVIDDVWDVVHLKPFIQGGPRCARVITTRVLDALPADAHRVDVDAMQQHEAIALLGHGMAIGSEVDLRALAARLGEWPLLLTLANAAIRDRVQATGQSIEAALAFINKALDKRGFTFFDARDPVARHRAVAKTVEISIDRLTTTEQQRFGELAVFPEDVKIPLSTVQRLWQRTGGLDDFDTESLAERLHRLSLIVAFDPTQRFIRLHDVIRQYLILRSGDRLPALHRELLEAHRPSTTAWADVPASEPYLWDHLAYHLEATGETSALVATALDLRYLAAKTLARSTLAAESDLRAAERVTATSEPLRSLRRSFVQAGHILTRCQTRDEVEATLYSRVQHLDLLAAQTSALGRALAVPHLRPRAVFPDLPHPALIRTLTEGDSLWGCAVSPDGSFVVSASYSGGIVVWDTDKRIERHRLSGHGGWVRRCAVSPDSTFIVSASFDRQLRVWDAQTGATRHVLVGHTDGVTDCVVSPDNALIVSASLDETVKIWDAQTGALLRTLAAQWSDERGGWIVLQTTHAHLAGVYACAISPDGSYIASASSDQTVKVWNTATGEEVHTLLGHESMVVDCAFSPDGSLVASAGADGTVRVWNCVTVANTFTFTGHSAAVNACAFDPHGRWLVSVGSDRLVKFWNVATGRELDTYSGHTDLINDCAVAPDGAYVVSAGIDGAMKLWESPLPDAVAAAPEQHTGWVNGCAVSRIENLAASTSSDATIRLWNTQTGAGGPVLSGHNASVRGCAFGPFDGQLVSASADKSARVWDVRRGVEIAVLVGHTDWVNGCCVSPTGHLVLTASSDRTLRLWDSRTWSQRLRLVAHADSVNSCDFARNGGFFISGSADATIKIWDVARAQEAWEWLPVNHQRFTEQDWARVLSPRVLTGHTHAINDCVIAADSSFIVSASSDRTLRIWDVQTGHTRHVLTGHRQSVSGCSIHPDGALIVSTSADHTVKVWRTSDGVCLATLHVDADLEDCAWTPDGQGVIATGAGGVYFMAWVATPTVAAII